ncbi:hypothetical protein EUTSA_v10014766mg [Eutrema salsugineum]|uniref:Transmembrane protein n=1 Tax=Eutrema salsugineum TaxID=72664 RepID=V4LJP5_EUTSA|nr:uncharacterized protein LOC18017099 [Eutrema salsugineum]ESQ42667.1 hypothetical protein EUTSA_v10014766mg [Eutrema salsugineum]
MYFAAIASSSKSFFLPNSHGFRHSFKPRSNIHLARPNSICCKFPHHEDETDSSKKNENQLAKFAIATLAVGVLALGSVGDASAAKSGGRIGGQAFRSSAPRPPPRINNRSRTNIYVNPPVAPPLIGGYGYGYGGYGWSPFSYFAPGPAVAVGAGGGFDLLVLFMFFGAASAVARNFFRSRNEEDDEDDY